jgi:DNA adenine methylase
MVWYMGSKAAHANEILSFALAKRKPGSTWVEPFVGGGNVICKVPPGDGPRIGSDINWRMIALLNALGNGGWQPPESMSEKEYNKIRKNPDSVAPELAAFAASGLSFGSKWFDVFARNAEGKDYCVGARNRALADAPGLKGCTFIAGPYDQLNPHIPPESIIYCDPPYTGTSEYAGAKTKIAIGESLAKNTWKPLAFWKWADTLVDQGHRVYVSEYTGPPAANYGGMTPTLKTEVDGLRQLYRTSAADPTSPASLREELSLKIADVERRIQVNVEAQAARWVALWRKKVTSDFSSQREGGDVKKEVEHLFHREP